MARTNFFYAKDGSIKTVVSKPFRVVKGTVIVVVTKKPKTTTGALHNSVGFSKVG